jgi:hypothetical protein
MKRQYLRILTALIGLTGFAITAKAQAVDQIVVTIPFEFSVGGKTLPAGTYRVNRASDWNYRELALTSFENRVGVLLVPTEVERASGDKPQISFEQVGDQHFLSKIETANSVFIIPVSRVDILQASAKSQPGTASGSSSGNN